MPSQSGNFDQVEVKEYVKEAHHRYQATTSKLRKAVRTRSIERGNQSQFQNLSSVESVERVFSSLVEGQDIQTDVVTITTKPYIAAHYIDKDYLKNLSTDDLKVDIQEALIAAMHRREDSVILEALKAGTYTAAPAPNAQGQVTQGKIVPADAVITNTAANLSYGQLLSAGEFLDENNVPTVDRNLVIRPNGMHSLKKDSELRSSDYVSSGTTEKGSIPMLNNFAITQMGRLGRLSGLSSSTINIGGNKEIWDNFAWNKSGLGLVLTKDLDVDIDWIGDRNSWLVKCSFQIGAGIIDNASCVKIQTYEG